LRVPLGIMGGGRTRDHGGFWRERDTDAAIRDLRSIHELAARQVVDRQPALVLLARCRPPAVARNGNRQRAHWRRAELVTRVPAALLPEVAPLPTAQVHQVATVR